MKTIAFVSLILVAISLACTAPAEILEVPVTVEIEVTRIVEQTIEVPVTQIVEVPVTQIVEVPTTQIIEVEVTRETVRNVEVEVTREVPVTVVINPTPIPHTPTPTRPAMDLASTSKANAWVYVSNNEYGWLDVIGDPAFDVQERDLDVFIDGDDCTNSSRIYGDDGGIGLVCGVIEKRHTAVSRVSIQTSLGDLRCARNNASDSYESVFACAWR